MKKILGKLALAALLSILPISIASALTITKDPLNLDGYTSGPGQLLYDFESGTAPAALSGDFTIEPIPSLTSTSAAPAGDTSQYYLSVPNPLSSGAAILTFSQEMSYLGLYWGSIDEYQHIDFYNNGILDTTVTGGMVGTPANGDQFQGGQNLYVGISDIPAFDKVVFTSNGYAFEIDNIAVAPVPEPATMLLFGTGVVSLIGIVRRKRS